LYNPLHATTLSRPFSSRRLVVPLAASLVSIVLLWVILETVWLQRALAYLSEGSPLLVAIALGQTVVATAGYPGLALVIFVENVFPPIPSDIILPLAGYTAATTKMTLFGAIVATTGGSLIGALVLYQAGSWLGECRLRRFCRRYGKYLTFEERELDRSLDWFRRHGSVVVMVARFVPVFRSLISIPAGMSGMPLGRFLIFTAIGAAVWNSGLISAGYLLGTNWDLVVGWLDQYQLAMVAFSTCATLAIALLRIQRYRRR
jgi:membrane protein DedA with SNARE-associated domain